MSWLALRQEASIVQWLLFASEEGAQYRLQEAWAGIRAGERMASIAAEREPLERGRCFGLVHVWTFRFGAHALFVVFELSLGPADSCAPPVSSQERSIQETINCQVSTK